MAKDELFFLRSTPVGIVGCGHLGLSLARALVKGGLPREKLLISHRGSAETALRVREAGLEACLADTRRVFAESGTVIVTVRPQDVVSLMGETPVEGALTVSFAAGVPLSVLESLFGTEVCRMMASGPEALLSGRGAAAFYPAREEPAALIHMIGARAFPLASERELDVFTAGMCLTAALLIETDPDKIASARAALGADYPLMPALFDWAASALPELDGEAEKARYIAAMATKGGVTEAIVSSLRAGVPLEAAMRRGIARVGELAAACRKTEFFDKNA